MGPHILLAAAMACALLAGCGGGSGGKWPTLAPRPGELSPMVPRTPMGACAGCGQDVFTTPPPPAAPVLAPVAADVPTRIDASDRAIAAMEAAWPAQAAKTAAAVKAAAGGDADAVSEAEVQRSRLESLLLPLAIEARALDMVEDDLAGRAGAAPHAARVAALRGRIAALEALRDAR